MIELSLIVFMIFVSVIIVVVATQERDNGEPLELNFVTNGTVGLVTVWGENGSTPIVGVMIRVSESEPEAITVSKGRNIPYAYVFSVKEPLKSYTELQRKLIDILEEFPPSILKDNYLVNYHLEFVRMVVTGLADHNYNERVKDRVQEVHHYLLKTALI